MFEVRLRVPCPARFRVPAFQGPTSARCRPLRAGDHCARPTAARCRASVRLVGRCDGRHDRLGRDGVGAEEDGQNDAEEREDDAERCVGDERSPLCRADGTPQVAPVKELLDRDHAVARLRAGPGLRIRVRAMPQLWQGAQRTGEHVSGTGRDSNDATCDERENRERAHREERRRISLRISIDARKHRVRRERERGRERGEREGGRERERETRCTGEGSSWKNDREEERGVRECGECENAARMRQRRERAAREKARERERGGGE